MSQFRMIAGSARGGTRAFAGIEIKLEPGWKTYWRVPGESGVPPSFDWSQSKNLDNAEVLYPSPKRFTDASGDVIGYKGGVIFPIVVTPSDPQKPVMLEAALEVGVCEKICIPVEVKLSLTLPAGAKLPELGTAFDAALDAVPRTESERRAGDPVISSKRAAFTSDKPELVLEVAFPNGAKGADLYLEGPSGSYVPLPERIPDSSGQSVKFVVDLSGTDLKDVQNQDLRVTVVSAAGSIETTWTPK